MDIKKELRTVLNIFLFTAAILILIGSALFISYYFLIYLEPNFDNESINYIKSASTEEVRPDSEINVELSYGNSGHREVKDFTVEFFIPQHTKLKISSQPGKYFKEKNSIIFESKSLKKEEGSKILITLFTDKPLDNGTVIILKDAQINYRVADKSLSGTIKSDVKYKIKSAPDIALSKMELKDKDGGDINMGDEISFGFNAVNTGDMNATGVEVTAAIPSRTSLIESSISPEGYLIKDGSITWNLGVMEINRPVDFSYNLKVLTGFKDFEKITGSAKLTSGQGTDLSAQAEGEVRLFPDLGNSKISLADKNGEFLWAGDRIIVKAILINDGERSAEQLRFNCPIPKNTSYVKDSAKCEGAEISFDNNELLFKIDAIKVDEQKEAVFEIQVSPKVTAGGVIKTSFGLSANGTKFDFPDAQINIKANYQVTIACLGDSLIALSNWPQILDSLLESTFIHADYNVIASGIRGEMASGGFNRFDSNIAKYKPQIVIAGYGTNDIGSGTDRFSYYLSGIVQKAKNINATVFLESLGYINTSREPSKSDWPGYQKVIYQVGASYGIPVVDIYTPLSGDPGTYVADWVHYTPEGSSVVAHTIYNYVIQYLDSEGKRK
ncbi:MAG: GDSL-type esterase/lipase family protein [Candidatus Humimicrobiaceae bacterium]